MTKAIVIDLQVLSGLGMQALLKKIEPNIHCEIVHSRRLIDNLPAGGCTDLVILGLNDEPLDIVNYLKRKARFIAGNAPIIICYQHFNLGYIKGIGNPKGLGMILKDNTVSDLDTCLAHLKKNKSFLCDETSQYMLDVFISRQKRTKEP